MTKPVLGAFAALLIALLGGWLWDAPGSSELDRTLRASELRDDLLEAHTSLLGARVDLYERNFRSASRQLEDARGVLRRAEERSARLGWRDEVKRLDLARFEADIDEAQRLLDQLDQGANSLVPRQGQAVFESVPGGSTSLRR
jgi:chromosome segregation ATPase